MSNYAKYNEQGELLDMKGKTLWEQLKKTFDVEKGSSIQEDGKIAAITPVLRYRPPYTKIATYDMRGDAVQLVVENVLHKDLPYYAAYVLGVNMINDLRDELHVEFVDYNENADNECIMDGAGSWAKEIIDKIPLYGQKCARGDTVLQDRSSAWYQVLVSCATIQGRRKSQEDRYVCLPSLSVHHPGIEPDIPLFAIFDGHNGHQVASYAAAHLPFEFGDALKRNKDVSVALTSAMNRLDNRIEKRCAIEPWRSVGSTAVVAALTSDHIHIRWLGDSPAFLVCSDCKQLTVNHNADTQKEINRVMEAGGEFIWRDGDARLQGVLSVSRSLGDVAMRPALSGEAEELVIERTDSQFLLVLTCDGITDVFKPRDIYAHLVAYINESSADDFAGIAQYIVSTALKCGSADNCTCIVVFLCDPKKVWEKFAQKQ